MALKTKVVVSQPVTPYTAQTAAAQASLLTPAQQAKIANQQTTATINAQIAASNASSKAEQAAFAAQENRAAGLAEALGSYGPEYAQAMSSAYNQAANTVAQLGGGVVASGGDAMQNALDAAKQSVAEKTAGQGQVQSYAVPDLTNTLTATGVNIPGNSLAISGVNAAQLGLAGAEADKANVMSAVDGYQQQAIQALQSRAAERASIIAQRPDLYNQAIEAQKQDNAQTQSRIDSLIQNAQSYLQTKHQNTVQANQNALAAAHWTTTNAQNVKENAIRDAAAKTAAQHQWWLAQVASTHVDPNTGKPVGGYTWADAAHTIPIPWTAKTSAAQNAKVLNLDTQKYNESVREYNKSFTLDQKAANTKAALAKLPGKYDKNLSAQLGYLSDSLGRPITDNGKVIAYKTPKGTVKPMDPKTQLQIQGTLSGVADSMANGTPANATKGTGAVKPLDIASAIKKMDALGYFTNPKIRQWALTALEQSYNLTPQGIAEVMTGIDPTTGGEYGATGTPGSSTSYGPTEPSGVGANAKPNDPRFKKGKPWNPALDPIASYAGSTIITKSGHEVDGRSYIS